MKQQRLGFQKLYQNLDKILFLFFIIFMLTEYAWLPFNSWAAGTLLRQTGYQFLSYNNVVGVLSSHSGFYPLVFSQSVGRLCSNHTSFFRSAQSIDSRQANPLEVYQENHSRQFTHLKAGTS